MKKRLLNFGILLMLLLAACGNEEKVNTTKPVKAKSIEEIVDWDEERKEMEASTETEFVEELQPLYKLNETTYELEPIGDANSKVVLLTIDDAPDKRALDMAKTLKHLDAPAIFFVNGHFITSEEKKAVLKEIHDMGFMIGNHTKSHNNLKKLSVEQQKEEILSVNERVEEVTGVKPVFFRAPFGSNTDYSSALVQQEDMLLMNWTYGYDWEKQYRTKEAITTIMIETKELRDGANLLMHDREWTADALEDIIAGLREKGYDFVDPATILTAAN